MGRTYENDCVGCEHCILCGRKRAEHIYCDDCSEEECDIYEFDGKELCIGCIEKLLDKVN